MYSDSCWSVSKMTGSLERLIYILYAIGPRRSNVVPCWNFIWFSMRWLMKGVNGDIQWFREETYCLSVFKNMWMFMCLGSCVLVHACLSAYVGWEFWKTTLGSSSGTVYLLFCFEMGILITVAVVYTMIKKWQGRSLFRLTVPEGESVRVEGMAARAGSWEITPSTICRNHREQPWSGAGL